MAVTTKIQPIDRDLIIRLTGTPDERSAMLAGFARDKLAEGEEQNRLVLGRVPPHQTYVDQTLGASEDSVKPDGVIVYEFELMGDALSWIGEQLQIHSPIGSGRDPHPGLYMRSHIVLADGVEIEADGILPNAAQFVFLNTTPYSRKIEKGQSPQAPDGVYEAVASLAASRFGNAATIRFSFWEAPSGGVADWAQTPSARSLARERRGGNPNQHTEWLTRQPAIVVTPR